MDDIRTVRRKLGVTQVELAVLLGLHQSTISRLEDGRLPTDERTKLALEAILSRHEAATAVSRRELPASVYASDDLPPLHAVQSAPEWPLPATGKPEKISGPETVA